MVAKYKVLINGVNIPRTNTKYGVENNDVIL